MTAPVAGSFCWPAWTQRVPKPSMLLSVIISSRLHDAKIVDEIETSSDAEEAAVLHNDRDEVPAKKRNELADWRIGRYGFEPRNHDVFHWQVERSRGTFEHRTKHVAFVNKTNNAIAIDNRQLRNIGS